MEPKPAMEACGGEAAWCTLLPWETRNLGRPAYAVNVEVLAGMSGEALQRGIAALERGGMVFMQARIEGHETRINELLEGCGFVFVESTIDPYCVLGRNEVLARFCEAPGSVLPRRFSVAELALEALNCADEGVRGAVLAIAEESFVADRFHVDHKCPAEQAGKRFRYWVEDLLQAGSNVFLGLRHRGTLAGFFITKEGHLILAGFARAYAGSGLGDYFWLGVLQRLQEKGVDAVHTRISMNNVPVVNLYARLGFKFRNPAAVFHYWTRA